MKVELEQEDDGGMNLAPLIDVVFLLLIFFMVATTFIEREKELGVDLPQAETGEDPLESPDELVINLLLDGSIRVNGVTVDEDGLLETLERAARANRETPVTIRGDRDVAYQRVVAVMDTCRVTGLSDIGLMTLDG